MSRLFIVLLRLLFPLDLVARSREIMRAYFQQITGWLADPLDIADFDASATDRAILESHIISAEQHFNLLVHERARQMLGLPFVYVRRQLRPKLRKAKSLPQLLKRLTRLARNFHTLEKLAARRADRIQRERDADPLSLRASGPNRFDAAHRSTSSACGEGGLSEPARSPPSREAWGRWIGASSRRDGGGCALARGSLHSTGPPQHPIFRESITLAPRAPPARSHPHANA